MAGTDPRTHRVLYPEVETCARCSDVAVRTWSKGDKILGFCDKHSRLSRKALWAAGWVILTDAVLA